MSFPLKMKVKKRDGGIMDTMDQPTSGRALAAQARDDANKKYNEEERNFDKHNPPGQYGSKEYKQQAIEGKRNPKLGLMSLDPMDTYRPGIKGFAEAAQKKRKANEYASKTGLEGNSTYAGLKKKREPLYAGR